jgi:hypothetical protein
MAGIDLVVVRFRDVPVLTEEAAHVAAGGAHGEDARAGKEMVQRLFLDGINLDGGGRGIPEAVQPAVFIDANVAEAGLALPDMAMARAKVAVDAAAGFAFPPESFVEAGGVLEDLESRHFMTSLF